MPATVSARVLPLRLSWRCAALVIAPSRVSRSRKNLHGMAFQRQAGGEMVFRHMFGKLHGGCKRHIGLGEQLVAHVRSEQGQRRFRLRGGEDAIADSPSSRPIALSRLEDHRAERRSISRLRKASASASRSMVKRETPAVAARRSTLR